jgi:hypothetical protein
MLIQRVSFECRRIITCPRLVVERAQTLVHHDIELRFQQPLSFHIPGVALTVNLNADEVCGSDLLETEINGN